MTTDSHDTSLVPVYVVHEPGLMPLVQMVLQQEQIEYAIRSVGSLAPVMLNPPEQPPMIDVGQSGSEVLVRAEDADRARELLEALEDAPAIEDPTTTE